jgi:hypothetical protein
MAPSASASLFSLGGFFTRKRDASGGSPELTQGLEVPKGHKAGKAKSPEPVADGGATKKIPLKDILFVGSNRSGSSGSNYSPDPSPPLRGNKPGIKLIRIAGRKS